MRRLTADDLISDVRSMIDEANTANVDDVLDILPALNRAQDFAANILSRMYESPMLMSVNMSLVGGEADYDIPEDAFEQRLEKVEIVLNNQIYDEVKRISYRDATPFEGPSRVAVPFYYSVIGTQFRLYPTPTGTYSLRLWILKNPEPLVKSQGRVTLINTSGNYVMVDEAGTDLTTLMDDLNSYVNVVDGETGKIKASLQIQSINGTKITFKTIPTRTSVLGKTIVSAVTAVEQDDLLCVVSGVCVPLFKKPFSNFLIQYAVAEITRKLGGAADMEERVKADLEKQVEHSWVGREQTLRIKKRSNQWGYPIRRYWGNG